MSPFIASHTRRFGWERLALGGSLVLLGVVLSIGMYVEYMALTTQEGERLQSQARVIDENLVRQLEGANNALKGVRDEVERSGSRGNDAVTSERLKLLSDVMPGVRTLAVVDNRGVIVASNRTELMGVNSSGRDFFVTPRQRPDRAVLYLAAPFTSPLGPRVIALGKVLTGTQGEFAGVVVATLDPEYFQVVLRSVLYAPDMRAALAHGDGEVFVNMPVNAQTLGVNLAQPGSMFTLHQQSGQVATLMTGRAVTAGDDRMRAMHTLSRADLRIDKPIVAAVSRDLSAIYSPWRDKVLRRGIFYAVLALGLSLGLRFSQQRRRERDRLAADAAKERQESAERLELALQGADLGLWDLHVPSGDLVVNSRERTLLGFSENDPLPLAGAWRNLIHPDDRAIVDAAIFPHLRGKAAAYVSEYRMRHKDGHYIWLSARAMIVERDANNRPLRLVGTHLDITERRRMDAELVHAAERVLDSEEQLRQVTDSLPVLISRWDPQQRFGFANQAYKDWLDIEPASLLGRSLQEVYGQEAYNDFRHHVEAALGGRRVVFEREIATPRGARQVEVTLVPRIGSNGSVQAVYKLVIDRTARHDAELQRARSEERLSLALEGSGLALFDWDLKADCIYQSAQASAMRDDLASDQSASPAVFRSFVHPEDLDAMQANMKAALKGAVPQYHAEFRIRKRAGDWLWVHARGRVVERDTAGRALRLAGTYADINARKVAEERLRRRAEFDTLTELPNRASFIERLQQAMRRATSSAPMALLFIDIDNFKTINDTFGHEAGDRLLKVFATTMRDCTRQSDMVARLAGDEFTIILEGLRDVNDATALASKLLEALRAPTVLAGAPFEVTVSIGVALWKAGDLDDAELLRRADEALYEAKRRGRNGYFVSDWSPRFDTRHGDRAEYQDRVASSTSAR
ncbi:diguanylate cyclase (GGDEF)-like protein/PAS domain S-box-containing protein [Variovorax boronicumulans]|uniref:sensor domain-containing diguanylate cyclase n=1 Tax=Variovorax boronicumulans TaxID=436515 RepID=UPI00278B8033|nr:diguanylate cyclase [Variovorax boronicumulans]MDQ0074462.1 diguanylate cyclase (GGDEF)-like protein/PAS domain S-box-containing protein [Variovorax boronicumulans]